MGMWTEYDLMTLQSRSALPASAGVYVIYFNGRPVYVGQSANVKARLNGYRFRYGYGKNIHTPWCEVCHTTPITAKVKQSRRLGDWAMWEIRLIARLQPQFNTHHLARRTA